MAAEESTKRKLTPKDVPALRDFFRTVPERTRMTSLEAVREMRDDIRALQDKGYSLIDIGNMIESQGFDLPLSTFRNYLKQVGHNKGEVFGKKKPQISSTPSSPSNRRKRKTPQERTSDSAAPQRAGSFGLESDKTV